MWSKFYGFMWGVNITKKAQKEPVALQSRQSMKRLTIKRGEKKKRDKPPTQRIRVVSLFLLFVAYT